MTDPRNVAHDKKIQQEKKHRPQVIAPGADATPQPGKKTPKEHPASDNPKVIDKIEHLKASMRAKVEHPFRVVKQQFGYAKLRYRGLAKNTARLTMLCVDGKTPSVGSEGMSAPSVRQTASASTQIETIGPEIRRQVILTNPSWASACESTARHRHGRGFADLP